MPCHDYYKSAFTHDLCVCFWFAEDEIFIENSWDETAASSDVEEELSDDNGNINEDCSDDPECEIHHHKHFYDKPKFPEIADAPDAPETNAYYAPASFILQTQAGTQSNW